MKSSQQEGDLDDLIKDFRWDDAILRMMTEEGRQELMRKDKYVGLPLHRACLRGAPLEVIEAMVIFYTAAVTVTDHDGRLPLHVACDPLFRDDFSPHVVRLLQDIYPEGASATNRRGDLPLHIAVKRGAPLETLRMLLDAYPEGMKATDRNGDIPIHIAVKQGAPLETLRMLLDAYPEGMKATDRNGDLPIHIAVKQGAPLETLRMLLDAYPKGASTNDRYGELPLRIALERGASPYKMEDVLKVDLLLRPIFDDEDACLVPDPWSGDTPLDVAAKFDMLNLRECLRIRRCPPYFIMVVTQRHPEQLRETDENGSFPLHIAAANPNFNGAQILSEVNKRRGKTKKDFIGQMVWMYPKAAAALDGDGRYPLHLAIESGKRWNEGVEAITDAAEHIVTVKDEATGLFPFMLASTVEDPCITTVYSLLRRCPELKRYELH